MAALWLVVPALAAALCLLYETGQIALYTKRALVYMGSLDGSKARFSGCTGSVRRVLRVRSNRMCRFELDMALTRGEVYAELYARKQCLLRLDTSNAQAEIPLEKGRRYHLVIRYRAAAGRHELKYR